MFSFSDPINGTERDCASQRYESQNLTNGTWHQVVSVEEPYEEGCSYVNDKGLLSATIQNCYCKGDTCNTSTRISTSNRYVFCAVILFCTFYFGWRTQPAKHVIFIVSVNTLNFFILCLIWPVHRGTDYFTRYIGLMCSEGEKIFITR